MMPYIIVALIVICAIGFVWGIKTIMEWIAK
jgi:preprotein translocase subunit SecE